MITDAQKLGMKRIYLRVCIYSLHEIILVFGQRRNVTVPPSLTAPKDERTT